MTDGRRSWTVPAHVLWLPWALTLVAVLVTYSRVAPEELYHVTGSGVRGGLSRALVLLDFPIALAAIAVIGLAADRLRSQPVMLVVAGVAPSLCLVVAWPGVVDEADLDWRPVNLVPALGVVLAVALGVRSGLFREPVRIRRATAVGVVLLLLASLPWLAAEWGAYLDEVAVLGWVFLTGEVVYGTAAVHHGHHHGMDGALLVLGALPLIPLVRRVETWLLRVVLAAFTGLQLAYGIALAARRLGRADLEARLDGLADPVAHPSCAHVVVARDRRSRLRRCGARAPLGSRRSRRAARARCVGGTRYARLSPWMI